MRNVQENNRRKQKNEILIRNLKHKKAKELSLSLFMIFNEFCSIFVRFLLYKKRRIERLLLKGNI